MSETVTIKARINLKRLRDLLVGAFEGGSNYWYMITGEVLRPDLTFDDFREGGKLQPKGDYHHYSTLIPYTPGCALLIGLVDESDQEDHKNISAVLNRASMRMGAEIMAQKYPRHWANFIAENDDAETADVYLQCCLFGELVYG